MEWAKNKPSHSDEQSDVALQMDCRARLPGLAMTNHEFISRSEANGDIHLVRISTADFR